MATFQALENENISRGNRRVIWDVINKSWQGDSATLALLARDDLRMGGEEICDVFERAINDEDAELMLVFCDFAEANGANVHLTGCTRFALRRLYS